MTDTQRARELLPTVTQDDREAAADAMKAGYISPVGVIDHVRAGRSDGNAFVQAFARHREAALATLPGREAVPKVYHLGTALQGIADEHAGVLTPRQIEALYQAASKCWATDKPVEASGREGIEAAAIDETGPQETLMVVKNAPLNVGLPDDWRECRHLWSIYGDGGDLGGNRIEVRCRKCQCPGDYDEDQMEVVWPTT